MEATKIAEFPQMVSVETLADLLGLTPVTVNRYAAQGDLPPMVEGMMPLRASVRRHVERLRANQSRGTQFAQPNRKDAEARFKIITIAIERLAADVDRSEEAHRLARLLLEAVLVRLDRLIAYSVDHQRTKLLSLASEVRADAERLLGEIGSDADGR
jgi:hypothetical protein